MLALVSLTVTVLCLANHAGIRHIQACNLDDQISVQVQAPDGTVSTYPFSHQFEAPAKGSTITVKVHLPKEDQIDNAALCFFNYNSVVTVRYQGQTLYQHGSDERAAGRTTGHTVARVPLPDEAWGNDVQITLYQLEDNTTSNIHGVYAMSATQAWLYPLLTSSQAEFVASFSFVIASIVLLVVFTGMLIADRGARQGIYLALFCLSLSLWDLCYTSLVYLVTDDTVLAPTMEYLTLHLVPVFFFGYLRFEFHDTARRRICLASELVTAGVAVLAVATEVLGVPGLGYLGLLKVLYVELAAMAVAAIATALLGGTRRDASRAVFRYGMGVTVVISLLEVVRVILNRTSGTFRISGALVPFVESTLAPVVIMAFEGTLCASYLIHLMRTLHARMERIQLERLAYTDALTGIPNRASLDDRLEDLGKADHARYTLLFFDVDHLKEVNDRLGHDAGDRMLQLVGRAIAESCSGYEGFFGRYGGDEFVACLARRHDADRAIRSFQAIIKGANDRGYLPFPMEVAVGRADHEPGDERTVPEELRQADDRMYEVKARQEGTGSVRR